MEAWSSRPMLLTEWSGACVGTAKLGDPVELQIVLALTARRNKTQETEDWPVMIAPETAIKMGEWLVEWGRKVEAGETEGRSEVPHADPS